MLPPMLGDATSMLCHAQVLCSMALVLLPIPAAPAAPWLVQEWQPDTLEFDWPSNPTEYCEFDGACAAHLMGGLALVYMQGNTAQGPAAASTRACSVSPSSACPPNRTPAAAAGKTVPPSADVQKLTALICSDPEAAGDQIRTAVDKGGAGAQVRGALAEHAINHDCCKPCSAVAQFA